MQDYQGRPPVLERAILMYQEMVRRSEIVYPSDLAEYGYPTDPKNAPISVYRGLIGDVAAAVGLPRISNHSVTLMYAMRSITLLSSANGPKKNNLLILNYEPSEESYKIYKENRSATNRNFAPSKFDGLTNDIAGLNHRINALADNMDTIARALSMKMSTMQKEYNDLLVRVEKLLEEFERTK